MFKFKGRLPSGSRFWQTQCGMLRLVLSEEIDGIPMPPEYRLWKWHRGGWCRVLECRSRKRAEKTAKKILEDYDSDD